MTSYFNHSLSSGTVEGLDFSRHGERTTITDLKAHGLSNLLDGETAALTELPMFTSAMQATLRTMAEKALFDEKLAKDVLPQLEVAYIYCTRSSWYPAFAYLTTKRLYQDHIKSGHTVRPIKFYTIDGANHFVNSAPF